VIHITLGHWSDPSRTDRKSAAGTSRLAKVEVWSYYNPARSVVVRNNVVVSIRPSRLAAFVNAFRDHADGRVAEVEVIADFLQRVLMRPYSSVNALVACRFVGDIREQLFE